MKLLLACAAGHLGEGVEGAMDDRETDHAVFNSREVLVQVTLPQQQAIHQCAILEREGERERERECV